MKNGTKQLTEVQKKFLLSILTAMIHKGGPVSTSEVRRHHGKSDSGVRSHIRRMTDDRYIVCVGKVNQKKMFVPTRIGMDQVADLVRGNPEFSHMEKIASYCIGGRCQKPGCTRMAEDYYVDGFYCRQCIIGCSEEEDMRDAHQYHETLWESRSVAGQVVESALSLKSEDSIASGDDLLDVGD